MKAIERGRLAAQLAVGRTEQPSQQQQSQQQQPTPTPATMPDTSTTAAARRQTAGKVAESEASTETSVASVATDAIAGPTQPCPVDRDAATTETSVVPLTTAGPTQRLPIIHDGASMATSAAAGGSSEGQQQEQEPRSASSSAAPAPTSHHHRERRRSRDGGADEPTPRGNDVPPPPPRCAVCELVFAHRRALSVHRLLAGHACAQCGGCTRRFLCTAELRAHENRSGHCGALGLCLTDDATRDVIAPA